MARHLSRMEMKALDRAQELLARQGEKKVSLQPRFNPKAANPAQFFYQIYEWAKNVIFEEPKYRLDSRKRDMWLRNVVQKEPYLNGVLQSVVSVDKNRGWTIVGGRNMVSKYSTILHNFQVAPDTYGWRQGMSVTSQSYYQSDIGAITEVGRVSKDGALAGFYSVDSAKCMLTGNPDFPLRYFPTVSMGQDWDANDYFRITSMPATDENMQGLGFCAISRCIELAKLMVSVFEHDRERMGSKAAKGILLINGITQDQWLKSLEESDAELDSLERQYYSGVQVLAGDGITTVDAKTVPLSNLPESFDHMQFTNMIIYGYALAFGYDPREFWPVSGGQLGTATETETQHKKATGKGGMDFSLNLQEKLQEELPNTLEFEFEQRDVDGKMQDVGLSQAQSQVILGMFQAANGAGESVISQIEARQLLAEQKLIPEEWTIQEEEVTVEDTEDTGEMLEKARVRRAIERFPDQDIVAYRWPENKLRVLKRAGVARAKIVPKPKTKTLFKSGSLIITEADVKKALAEAHRRLGEKTKIGLTGG